ncbi:MAG: recombinase family protein [Dehalococcoidales bacterium]
MREVNLFEAEIVREMFNRVAAGEALVLIGRDLNNRGVPTKATVIGSPEERKLWHNLTIRRIIHNQAYMGKTYFGMTSRVSRAKTIQHPQDKWISLPDASPPIVREELFHLANNQLAKPKARTGRPKNDYLLRHHVFCAVCGRPLVGHCLNKKYRYYQCSRARPIENAKHTCRARLVRAYDLENTVWEKIKEVLRDPQIVIAEITKQRMEANGSADSASLDNDITTLEKKLCEYDKRRNNLLEAMELGEFDKDEILDRLNNLKLLRSEDETRLKQLLEIKANISNLEGAQVKLDEVHNTVLENIENCPDDVKKLALDALDIKVNASIDNVEIHGVLPLTLHNYHCTNIGMFVQRCVQIFNTVRLFY